MNSLILNFLLKANKNKDKEREFIGSATAIVGISSNVLLFLIKLIVGVLINSISVISDSFNNLSDTLSSGISLYAIKSSSKPADREHPFGHGRSEYIAALIVSFFIMLVGWEFLKTSFGKIIHPEELGFSIFTTSMLFVTVLIKVWQYTFNKFIGNRIDSKVLVLTARDSLNDAVITTVTIISILFTYYTGFNIDGYIGFILSCILLYQGYTLIRDTISPLIGEAIDRELATQIREFIEKYDEVIGTHDLIVHNYGPQSNICTIHVEVSRELDLYLAHNIVDNIENDMYEELGIIATLHLDPVDINNQELNQVIVIVKDLIEKEKVPFSCHDFRMISMDTRSNIIFELEIPYNFDEEVARNFTIKCSEEIANYNQNFNCIINLEHSFVL